ILHVNDHHSHLAGDKFMLKTFGIVPGAAASAAVSVEYGGYARLVPLFAELEKSGNVLKLHAGDAITGTSYYSLFQGAADATAMAEVCFDAFALGNHEFDGGDAPLADFLDELQVAETKFGCPVTTKVLAANVHPGADSPLVGKIHNSTVFTVGGQRIGVVGVDIKGKTMMSSSPSPGTKLSDELMAAQFNINALIADGVDKIVLLSHIGFGMDAMLAPELSGVDVIIGGDSHSMLGGTAAAMIKQPEAAYPYQLLNKDGDPVCIGQAWEYAHVLGHMKVSFDAKGVVVKCGGDVAVPVNIQSNYANAASVPAGSPAVPPLDAAGAAAVNAFFASRQIFHPVLADASTTAALADYTAQIKILSANVIATVPAKICLDRFPGEGRGGCDASQTQARGGAVGNLVATGFLHNAPVADIAIQNGGGCRVSIVAGDFTFNDAYTLLPFANTLINIEMTGAQIKQVLEDTLTNTLDMGGSTGGYPYAAGIRFHVDASAVANSRISYLEVNSRLAGTWAAIDAAKKYTVVTNSYTAGGKDGYVTFGLIPAAKKVDTYIEYAQSMVNYAEAVGTLVAPSAADFSTQQYTDKLGIWHGSTEAPAPVPTAAP
ncbi:Metallo-dependent phosphatase-like protein, partial [Pelagophyceae sp. CCMP2097]